MTTALQSAPAATPAQSPLPPASAAEYLLHSLSAHGIDCLFVGSGTDTAPVIEAYARQPESGLDFPTPIVAAHENVAVGMAHGYTMVSSRPQAVMLHVSVGAANALCGIMNAARAQIPMFFMAGRTPLFEEGPLGARDNTVHWGQEMYDQGGMLREFVKWDYELRDARNLPQLVNRGMNIAMAAPPGPVYLTLPREILAQTSEGLSTSEKEALPAGPSADPSEVKRLASALASARHPVIVCTGSGADPETVGLLVALAERFGFAIAESKPRFVNFPTTHPQHVGFDMEAVFQEADALLFLECDVPWLPAKSRPREDAFVAHVASDPLFQRYPVRSFRSNLSMTSTVRALVEPLTSALDAIGADLTAKARCDAAKAMNRVSRAALELRVQQNIAAGGPIDKLFLTKALEEVRSEDDIVINEYSAMREHMNFSSPGTFFYLPNSGGLGWGLPAALGAKLAQPKRTVLAVVGDGAYMFANPAACHQAAAMHGLPILTVIFNNGGWDAVQQSTLAVYAKGHAAGLARRQGAVPLACLDPLPDFEKYSEASGGWAERVTTRSELVPALRRAIAATRSGQQALLNVVGK